jgi:hypothetical protein
MRPEADTPPCPALPASLAPLFLFEGHALTMNSFEPLLWTA